MGLPTLHWVVHTHVHVDSSGWTLSCSKRREEKGAMTTMLEELHAGESQGRWREKA